MVKEPKIIKNRETKFSRILTLYYLFV